MATTLRPQRLPCRGPLALLAALPLALALHAAHAAPADDARTHFEAVAAGQVDTVMASYADNAQFNWVGGPLDGTYVGADAIRGVWTKFAKAQGPLKLSVGDVQTSANPAGATVSARVMFEGKAPIKVRYVITYRSGRIVAETWQIDPSLDVAAAY